MADTAWLKQTKDTPLFGDLLWSRPENRVARGKLLAVGGNAHSFVALSEAFAAANKAGAGSIRAVAPDALEKTLAKVFPEAEFAPSTLSGSFARASLAVLLDQASWADGVLLAGDFGKNSETAIVLESLISKYQGGLTLVSDSLDYFAQDSSILMQRPNTALVGQLAQLQKLAGGYALLKHSMDLNQLVGALNKWTAQVQAVVVTYHAGQITVSFAGRSATTQCPEVDFIKLAAFVSVWQLQQLDQPFEAAVTATYDIL